ncbi:MAG: AraC family transcriptional regulator [Planctomycetes bacterium]|nr:AraC family transcriptional regulator [Planctomycetota bacterium]
MGKIDNLQLLYKDSNAMGIADYPAGSRFGPRNSQSFEFVWIISGDVEWICDGESHLMAPGSICLVQPDAVDSFIWDSHQRTRHGYIHFQIKDHDSEQLARQNWPKTFQCGNDEFLLRLLNHVIFLAQNKDDISQNLAAQGLNHATLCFIHQRAQGVRVDSGIEENPYIQKSMEYVRSQWRARGMHNPAVDDIATAVGLSRGHLVRLFTNELGMSPAQCIRSIRLDHAANMLTRSNMTVQDISEECGFENQFHFSRAFKKAYTLSPRHYREHILAGKQVAFPVRAKVQQLAQQFIQDK